MVYDAIWMENQSKKIIEDDIFKVGDIVTFSNSDDNRKYEESRKYIGKRGVIIKIDKTTMYVSVEFEEYMNTKDYISTMFLCRIEHYDKLIMF